jgi:hypothetical protein
MLAVISWRLLLTSCISRLQCCQAAKACWQATITSWQGGQYCSDPLSSMSVGM